MASYQYTLRADGRRVGAIEAQREVDGTYSSRQLVWEYDALNRLIGEASGSTLGIAHYATRYKYDLVGNRLRKAEARAGELSEWTYGYNENDQLLTEDLAVDGAGRAATVYGWDENGSLTSKSRTGERPETCSYAYNLENRLAAATIRREENGQALDIRTDYVYDNSGIRVFAGESAVRVADGQVVFDRSRRFLLDSQNHTGYAQVLEEYDGAANLAKSYLIGDDVIAQASGPTYPNPAAQYLLYDGHGSTRGLTSGTGGTIQARFDYDAYGMTLGGEPSLTSPAATDLLYTGEQYDAGLQQYYLRARYYNQCNGSFSAVDPFGGSVGQPRSLQKYAYVYGDPLGYTDPAGLFGDQNLPSFLTAGKIWFTMAALLLASAFAVLLGVTVSFWWQTRAMVPRYGPYMVDADPLAPGFQAAPEAGFTG